MVFCSRKGDELCFVIKEIFVSKTMGVGWSEKQDHPYADVTIDEHDANPTEWKRQFSNTLRWMQEALDKPVVDEDAVDEDLLQNPPAVADSVKE